MPPAGPGLPPLAGEAGLRRDAMVAALTDRVLVRRGLGALDRATRTVLGRSVDGLLFDGPLLADRLLVTTVPGFEHPRVDLPSWVRYVGPVAPPAEAFDPPPWWGDLDGGRPVVHVTQGTMANGDLGRLVGAALAGLADLDVLAVASTGGRAVAAVPGLVPANARVATHLPYDHLLPRVDVMVTNGGWGGVQRALAAGIPLVCAGDGEDKPEVAARVVRAGVGIDLGRRRPRPAAVRDAVQRVLAEPRYRQRAAAIAAEMAGYGGVEAAADEVEALLARPS